MEFNPDEGQDDENDYEAGYLLGGNSVLG